jgi:hypothetical protein
VNKILAQVLFTALAAAVPCAAQSQTTPAGFGVGPHGFDSFIGTWSCTNSLPSAMGGPNHQTLTVTRTATGALMYHSTGVHFDNTWYDVYVPKTKTWWSPFIVADGSYGTESTTQTGRKIVWVGTAVGPSGSTMQIRDTNVNSANTYSDLGEYKSGGSWKAQYDVSCTRT